MKSYYKYYYNEELLEILDEDTLTNKFKEMHRGDSTARLEIIEHNLALVMSTAKKYSNNYYDVEDLISIGAIGLIKAVDKFNIDKGIIFATYARRCIENEILMQYRRNKKHKNNISLNTPIKTNRNGHELLIENTLEDFNQDFVSKYEDQVIHKEIRKFIKELPERERYIVMMYFGFIDDKTMTQSEIAKELNLNQPYISRLLKKVLNQLSIHLKQIEEIKKKSTQLL